MVEMPSSMDIVFVVVVGAKGINIVFSVFIILKHFTDLDLV